MKTIDMYRLLKSGTLVVPFSYYNYNIANVPQNSIVLALPEFATLPNASIFSGCMVRNTTDGKVYESRKAGRLSGTDAIIYNAPASADGLKSDFELEFLFKSDGLSGSEDYILGNGINPTRSWRLVQRTDGIIQLKMRQGSDGSVHRDLTIPMTYIPNVWRKIKLSIKNETVYLSCDGLEAPTYTTVGWEPEVSTRLRFYGYVAAGSNTYTAVANFKLTRTGSVVINSPINDGSGSVIADLSGNGNYGNLTDGSPTTFWGDDYLPIEATGDAIRYHADDVKQKRKVLKNAGTDSLSLGRPAALINLLDPASQYRIETVSKMEATCPAFGAIIALGKVPNIQMQIAIGATVDVRYFDTGSPSNNGVGGSIPAGTYAKVSMRTNATQMICDVNGTTVLTRSRGTYINATEAIRIGSSDSSTGNQIEGSVALIRFFDVISNLLVDVLDFNDPAQWSGGLSGVTAMGNPFTITNGAPTETYVDDLVPVRFL